MTKDNKIEDSAVTYHFSATGTLQEVLRPLKRLEPDDTNERVMPDGKLFKPVKVFEEGEYVTGTRNGKLIKFKATKERMETWVRNAYRDVPFNFDHEKKSGGNEIGWLRTATGNTFVSLDEKTGKYSLYTQPEFTEQAYNQYVANGRYRDFSLEIDPQGEYITAIALTNYPRLKTLTQMSELASLDEETQVAIEPAAVPVTVEVVTPDETVKEEVIMPEDIKTEPVKTAEEIRAELEAQMQAEFSELQNKLKALEAEKELEAERARKSALVLEMSQKVDKLINSEDGKSVIPVGSRQDAIELFSFLADHEGTMLFSELEEDKRVSPTDLLVRLLEAQANFSEVMSRNPLENAQLKIPSGEPDEERADVSAALRKIYQSRMKQ